MEQAKLAADPTLFDEEPQPKPAVAEVARILEAASA
jgi:GH35 family endo-1,4-beta-xylanase